MSATDTIIFTLRNGEDREAKILRKPLSQWTSADKAYLKDRQKYKDFLKACGIDYRTLEGAGAAKGAFE